MKPPSLNNNFAANTYIPDKHGYLRKAKKGKHHPTFCEKQEVNFLLSPEYAWVLDSIKKVCQVQQFA